MSTIDFKKSYLIQQEIYNQPLPVRERTTQPIHTGSSVIGIKFAEGVMIATDTQISYGSLAQFRSIQRIHTFGNRTLIAASGEYSDFQFLLDGIRALETTDICHDDGKRISAPELHSWVTRVMGQNRAKMNPLWNYILIAGVDKNRSFLGYVDLVGTNFEDNTLATGLGDYIARPLLRKAWRPDLTEQEARKTLEDCMRVLFYRDARAINKIQIGTVTATKCEISEPILLDTTWI
eukprot:TRINITY_DN506_c5_g1_i1.p1 TRINITY_DN506_c5_g1~~TRINITY_DN506_c5_g1_i1.p1  ORF type:complete len:235 (-),score=118.10 TRINITY_DN506_c5_g1_i1:103-807(-)